MTVKMTLVDRPLRGPLVPRAVQEHIKQYIIKNHLHQGDLLPPETQIAQDLGISRGSVREAVKALETLGIVEVRHGNGLFVRGFSFDALFDLLSFGFSFDPDRMTEVLQIREWLEDHALEDIVRKINDKALAEIDQIMIRWDERVRREQSAADEDRAFHHVLASATANQALIKLLDIFWVVFNQVPVAAITRDPHLTVTLDDHRRILAAVRARDAVQAHACLQEHFRRLDNRIAQAINDGHQH